MKRGMVILILLSFLLFAGCEGSTEKKESLQNNDSGIKGALIPMEFKTLDKKKLQYEVLEHSINVPDDWVSGDVSANEESLFYIIAEEQYMGNAMLRAKVMRYDMGTDKEIPCFQYENEDGFYLNELEATSDFLFWVRTEGEDMSIECLNLSSGELSVIEEKRNDSVSILLQTDGKFLTWYMVSENSISLQAYDIEKQQHFVISESVALNHPYLRANIQDGITFFITEKDGENFVHIYDMKEKKELKEITMDAKTEIFNGFADDQYYIYSIFSDGAVDYRIFVYDYIRDELYLANEKEDASVFSFHFIDEKLFINDWNSNGILIRDIENLTESVLMNEEEHLYILASDVEGKGYVALDEFDSENPKILFVSQR